MVQAITINAQSSLVGKRILGVDLFRLVAFLCVVALHVNRQNLEPAAKLAFEIIPRLGVPYFFLVSGYFLQIGEHGVVAVVARFLRRLVPVYVFWVLFYIFLHRGLFGETGIHSLPNLLIDGIPGAHLWFLPSLGVSVVLFTLLSYAIGDYPVLGICIILYLCGIYFDEFRNIYDLPFHHWNFRDGPFFGCVFIAIGYYSRKYDIRLSVEQSVLMVLSGLAMQFLERALLVHFGILSQGDEVDYYLGTVLYGAGVLFLALNVSAGGEGAVAALAGIGRYTLGFYCIHLAYVWLLEMVLAPDTLVNVVVTVAFSSSASIITILLMSRVRQLRWLIQ